MDTSAYGMSVKTGLGFDAAIEATTHALADAGFGILTRIDVRETLKAKLGVDVNPYVILGACNPQLAHRGLEIEPELGLLLPCNVIVYQEGDEPGGGIVVAATDPGLMARVTDNPDMEEVAVEARNRLQKALEAIDG